MCSSDLSPSPLPRPSPSPLALTLSLIPPPHHAYKPLSPAAPTHSCRGAHVGQPGRRGWRAFQHLRGSDSVRADSGCGGGHGRPHRGPRQKRCRQVKLEEGAPAPGPLPPSPLFPPGPLPPLPPSPPGPLPPLVQVLRRWRRYAGIDPGSRGGDDCCACVVIQNDTSFQMFESTFEKYLLLQSTNKCITEELIVHRRNY